MRNFYCHFGPEGGKITQHVCWNPLNWSKDIYPKGAVIHIDKYQDEVTEKYVKLLVGIINEIQPCSLVEAGKKTYISYKIIGIYNNDLILLNFIRNLWHEHKAGYAAGFFTELKKLAKSDLSPMEKLTAANVAGVASCAMSGNGHHSPCHERVKVQKLPKSFYSRNVGETRDFLTK